MFALSKRHEDGRTQREHLQAAGMPVDATAPPYPRLGYLLDDWAELSATRPVGMGGPAAIPYSEIAAWSALTGQQITPVEVELLRRLDGAFLAVVTSNG